MRRTSAILGSLFFAFVCACSDAGSSVAPDEREDALRHHRRFTFPDASSDDAGSASSEAGADSGGSPTDAGTTSSEAGTPPPGKPIYVAQNTSGSGAGSSCADAHGVAWFNDAASWGTGASQIGPGTTVHLCGAFTFPVNTTGLTVQGSGASGAPIAIFFEPGAVLRSPAFPNNNLNAAALVMNHRSFILVDGGANGAIENTANGSTLAYHQASEAINAGGCDSCEIRNLAVHNLYVHSSTSDLNDMDGNIGIAISGSNWRVHDCVLHDVRWALSYTYQAGETNNQIDHNEVYNIDHGFTVAGSTTGTASNLSVHDNYVHDYANWDTTNDMFHHDGIHAWNSAELSGASTWGSFTGMYIYNNRFDGNCGATFNEHIFLEGGYNSAGRTPWTQNFASPNAFIYGNLFRCTDNPPRAHTLFGVTGPAVIFNNTLIGNDPVGGDTFWFGGAGLGGTSGKPLTHSVGLDVRNNLSSGEDTVMSGDPADTWAHKPDHQFYGYYTGSYNAFWGFGVDTSDFAAWKSACQCDGSSMANAGALTVVDAAGKPTAGSWLIGNGQNMFDAGYDLPGMGVDIAGVKRPGAGGGAWDIGAYQHP